MWGVNWWDAYGLMAVERQSTNDWISDTELALRMLKERDALLHDCIFTPHRSDDYLVALWGARCLLSDWVTGKVEIAAVVTYCEAPSDKKLASFSLKLPYPLEIKLWGGINDFDGVIKWLEPIPFVDCQGNVRMHEARDNVPVEVGDCHPMKMYVYLVQCGYIARYPYGWEWILIFHLNPSEARKARIGKIRRK